MVMSVDTPENKGLLWNVLLENGSFAGIPETKIGEVNVMLDVVVEEVVGMDGIAPTMESNKLVLVEMARRLREYGETNPAPTTHTAPATHPTNREDLQKERIDRMNDMAKKMSADMARYEPKKPKSVRFSDDVDKLSPELLESRLAQAIASRQLDVVVLDVSGGGDTTVDAIRPLEPSTSPETTIQEIKRLHGEVKAMYDEMKLMMAK